VLLRAVAKEARPARRRLVVGIAFAVFLGGLLTAARLAIVVLGTSLVIVVLVGSTSAVRVLASQPASTAALRALDRQHRHALEILSYTNDLHAVALTQNNLALVMSHAGNDPAATLRFEQAAATVRELGDQEREGSWRNAH
jgi:NhaP-type Na+/H+ and K+/H+ antiporter